VLTIASDGFVRRIVSTRTFVIFAALLSSLLPATGAFAGEANLVVPDLNTVEFLGGIGGGTLLTIGLVICIAGLLFGIITVKQIRQLPVHPLMGEVSDVIYETCKTYLKTQGKFILLLEVFIGAILIIYFGFLARGPLDPATNEASHGLGFGKVAVILFFSLVGIAGSYAVAWFGMRVNTLANSRTAMASLRGEARPVYSIPLKSGMSIGMVLISVELFIMLVILLFIPGELAGPCFIGFAVGESLGAAALRVAGGIFTKIADIGADLMKIVFKIKEDDARNPGVIADCVGDNAGDSVGPTADGFETYGVTGVALITFILLAVSPEFFAGKSTDAAATSSVLQVQLLVWIFAMRLLMVVTSALAYFVTEGWAAGKYRGVKTMNFEVPLTVLVWVASILSIIATYIASYLLIGDLNGNGGLWWKLSTIITCGTLAGAIIPEVTKVFTSMHSRHVREVVQSSQEGGASLNILSGLTAGNFSAFWVGGVTITGLMAIAYLISQIGGSATGLATIMPAEAIFAFGLVAFGFMGMGPVTIAVDSYGPVTDNAQSVYELSLIESSPTARADLQKTLGVDPNFEHAKQLLEENDGCGNTFKATAKPVLIGTAVVGATTMIFSIIILLTQGLTDQAAIQKLSILHAPFMLGLIAGSSVIYWFAGASTQAVVVGAYRAVEFIKKHIKLEGADRANVEDSKKVVEICTLYAQKGMLNCFLTVFFITLATAFIEEYFFIGYLIGIAITGLFQAIFMANAGGAWDNAKKIVEVELKAKGTPLHDATVVGDTVGDPFKDTSSVALNPIIKFTTLFGLLAVELGIELRLEVGSTLTTILSGAFAAVALFFVYRSFYGMRIKSGEALKV